MKLALVRQSYNPFGGAERFLERAAASLAAKTIDVTIVARKWSGDGPENFLRCDPFFLGRTWRDRSFCRDVQAIIASGRFDLVQSHERIPGCHIYRAGDGVHATWLELRNATRGGLARIATDVSPWHRYILSAESAMFAHPELKAVICNSRMVRDDIARRFGVSHDKLHVIYNGIDFSNFNPVLRERHRSGMRAREGISDSARILLFVGSGYERKGLATLLRAIVGLKVNLWVVGRDKDEILMRKLAQTLDVDRQVRFFGGQEHVEPYYGAADIFVLPTLYDPMPNAALEALASGLPVITTTMSGAAEFVVGGHNGFIFPPLETGMLKHHIKEALEMRFDPEKISLTVSTLGMDSMTDKLVSFYSGLLGRQS